VREIAEGEIVRRMAVENPWWVMPDTVHPVYDRFRHRAYIALLYPIVRELGVRRAVLLMGPRRVGKTVMIHQVIRKLIGEGIPSRFICYLSVDHPMYNGLSLDRLLDYLGRASGVDHRSNPSYVFLDEIQYLRDWELHLKTVVDSYPKIQFTASGSAAAALRLKSVESGAGRFTDFLLPPLTFREYLELLQKDEQLIHWPNDTDRFPTPTDIDALNESFLHYLNYGGYPEAIFSEEIQQDPRRFIKADIVDKVLLRDLPSLYGIRDIQELNYLFTTLAYNTAGEVSLEELSKNSGVAKNTLKRYIEYLEAAFLIKTVHRIDRNGKRFRRANFFKVYLTNPSIRSALFAPVTADDEIGSLAETAIYAQWFHHPTSLYYARWRGGEVDIVHLHRQKPAWAVEVKWSDRALAHLSEVESALKFCRVNRLTNLAVTTRSISATREVDGVTVMFVPASVYCYAVGHNILAAKRRERMEISPKDLPQQELPL
jgi:predicted AAA+ superfamily ATPase